MYIHSKRNSAVVVILLEILCNPPAAKGQSLTFTTLAGPEGGPGFEDGTGSAARFRLPVGVATFAGSVYVADADNHTIRHITPAGIVTTLAGLAGVSGSADGTGSAARFNSPGAMAIDGFGDLYIADLRNHTIRKITEAGVVSTLAGLAGAPGSADGSGSAARFFLPSGLTTDARGNVYVGDQGNHAIRKISAAGDVTTLAGLAGFPGSADGLGSAARFNSPNGVAFDGRGNVYVADRNNQTIRRITAAGAVTTLAGVPAFAGSADGTGSSARFSEPIAVTTDFSGNVYVADRINHTIRRITPAGVVTTLAGLARSFGSADGLGSGARFFLPAGVTADSSGNLYVADTYNHTARKITAAGEVTTLAGLADPPSGSGDGMGSAARFNSPDTVATDGSGNVYVADTLNHTIRKVTPSGAVSTLAGLAGTSGSADGTGDSARFRFPGGVAIDGSGDLYVADSNNHTIRKITPAGAVTTLAGFAGVSGSADGTGTAARFNQPYGVALDDRGNVYVSDQINHTIRKMTPAGAVTTLAGLARAAGSIDGIGSAARFFNPSGVATDSSGNLYVADTGNETVRKITPDGAVTTLAGLSRIRGSADGTGTAALFNSPAGVATDIGGNLHVSDFGNYTIRRITPSGVVTTTAGLAGVPGNADGTGSAARFNQPRGVATDNSGNVYVADRINNRIRKGRATLADIANIDLPTGRPGHTRQLDTSPQTADSWRWSVIRRPARFSTASLSSTTLRNPTFTPDALGLFIFRLEATGPSGASITTLNLTVEPYRKGDVNGDESITVADVFYLIDFIFRGGPAPLGSADFDDNGGISVSEIFYLINFLFTGGPAPL